MNYVLAGNYYIPDLKLSDEERPIGKYGRMHRDYLKEHRPIQFNHLVLEGQLWTYLADLKHGLRPRVPNNNGLPHLPERLQAGCQNDG